MTWTVPNLLTVTRLLSAPMVLLVYLLLPRPIADWVALVLFVAASATDWFDGYLARAWGQQTKLGAMLDPIADKAMVVIALAALVGVNGMHPVVVLPAAVILFREVFVSGLREFLGDTAGTLQVTKLAKWKTTVQMVAVSVLLVHGVFEVMVQNLVQGMDVETVLGVLEGRIEDVGGLNLRQGLMLATWYVGGALLSLAAVLTAITGWDYFTKALPYLKD